MRSIINAMHGETLLVWNSFLANKKGTEVASKLLNIREDNNVKNSPYNRSFDDELYPISSKVLIENGVLKTYLHNMYTSEKMQELNTGNKFDREVNVTNAILKKGSDNVQGMLQKIDTGAYLINSYHGKSYIISGSNAVFHVKMPEGHYVEKGVIKYPLKETTIRIDMQNLMKNIIAVGSDVVPIRSLKSLYPRHTSHC